MVSLRYGMSGSLLFLAVVVASAENLTPPSSAKAKTLVFDCDDLSRAVARVSPLVMELTLPSGKATLTRGVGVSQEPYSDGRVTFWTAGNYARIDEPDGTHICRSVPTEEAWEDARSRGIDVRAAGEDPDWSVEIDEGNVMAFVGDFGATRVIAPAPLPQVDPALGRTTYYATTAEHTLSVALEHRLCWFRENSNASSATVTVTLDESKVYRGCGRPLPSGRLAGTAVYDTPMALPVGSELRVRIVNLSGQLRPREIIAEQTTSIEGHGPIRFEINYDRSRIYGGDVYGIEATICVDGKPRWSTRTFYPALTRGAIGFAQLVLEAVRQPRITGARVSTD
jgi:uncharacterized lipoprotein YbaY/membrane-bound inhibitor of C-type lysozyme